MGVDGEVAGAQAAQGYVHGGRGAAGAAGALTRGRAGASAKFSSSALRATLLDIVFRNPNFSYRQWGG